MTATAPYTPSACPVCGQSLPADAPAGLCPRCLLSDGFGAPSEAASRFRSNAAPRFVPPPIEDLAAEFPNLEFVRLLGSGGMGAVYLAKQIRLDRPIAVKILPPDLSEDPAFAERFLREVRALARLSHPHIVGVYDFGQSPGGLYYFLMEYIEGPTLRQVVANRSADAKQALEIVRQVCDALQFAHDKGVVHRDIKPENILVDHRGNVKIADFGLAKLLGLAEPHAGSPAAGSLTATRQAMGTPHYMAPEQITGSRSVDHRADIYSLGVVFYELLTGELPLGRFAPPSRKVQVDVRLDEVVLRTLEAEPAQRYQRAGDVKTDVESISFLQPRNAVAERAAAAKAHAMRFVREASAGANFAARTVLAPAGPGELSRLALFAMLWAASVPLALIGIAGWEMFERWIDPLAALFATMVFVMAIPAFTAPLGVSVLGILAVRSVRHSGGRVTGLVPGLAATLFFPLLILDLFLWWFASLFLVFTVTGPRDEEIAIAVGLLFALPVAVWLNVRIVHAAWQMATDGLPAELIKRELNVIPPVVRRIFRSLLEWHKRWFGSLFGRAEFESGLVAGGLGSEEPDGPTSNAAAETQSHRPRVSFKAIVGAIWAGCIPIAAGALFVVADAPRIDLVPSIALGLLGLFALPAVTAPIATTSLGWMAIADIRYAAGRLTGRGLAVFDALFFPLLLLDAALVAVSLGIAMSVVSAGFRLTPEFGWDGNVTRLALPLAFLLSLVVDALVVRAVWRASKKPNGTVSPDPNAPASVEQPSQIDDEAPERRFWNRDLFAAAVAIGVALLLFTVRAWNEGWGPFAGEVYVPKSVEIPIPSGSSKTMPVDTFVESDDQIAQYREDSDGRWRLGPNGPELSPDWASDALRIDSGTKAQVDAALQTLDRAYERLLIAHTKYQFVDDEEITFTVEPFAYELEDLENAFWKAVDPLLTRDQQVMLRANLQLRAKYRSNSLKDLFENKIMPLGANFGFRNPFQVTIGRSGLWYTYTVSKPDSFSKVTVPELPLWLHHIHRQYEMLMSLRHSRLGLDPERIPLIAPRPVGGVAGG